MDTEHRNHGVLTNNVRVERGTDYARAMRGRTASHLVATESGRWYVVKHLGNPCGPSVLVGEWLGWHLMRYLGLPIPEIAIIHVDQQLAQLPTGAHIGSCYPGNPSLVTVYDFLPESLFNKLIHDDSPFIGAHIFDLWAANADMRQSIFVRKKGWEIDHMFLDNSHLFGGPGWTDLTSESTPRGFYNRPLRRLNNWNDCSPWLEAIEGIPSRDLFDMIASVPEPWITGEDRRALYTRLIMRAGNLRRFLRALIEKLSLSTDEPHFLPIAIKPLHMRAD